MIAKISTFCFLLPIIVGIIQFSKLPHSLKLVFYTVLISGFVDTLALVFHAFNYRNSIIFNLYIIPYAFIWSYPFYHSIAQQFYKRFILLSFIGTATIIIYLFSQESILTEVNGKALAFSSVYLIMVNLCYLFFTAVKSEKLSFKFHPLFSISAGVLIYHALLATVYALMNDFDIDRLYYLWELRAILYLSLNIVISIVFWKYAKNGD